MIVWPFNRGKISKERLEKQKHIAAEAISEEKEIEKLANKLKGVLEDTTKEVIFLCIGSDRSTGDSFGPMVGTLLNEEGIHFPVFGTLEEPIHALNIKKILRYIDALYNEPLIIAIDACLGEENEIGLIVLSEGPIYPGKAFNKKLPSVGHFHLKAFVNYHDPYKPMESLNTTRLYTVMKLAEITAKIISRGVSDYQIDKNDLF